MQEVQETQVQPLGRKDPLEEEIATHSSILAGIIPWIEEPGRQVRGVTMSWTLLSEQLCQSGGCAQAKPLTLAILSTFTLEFSFSGREENLPRILDPSKFTMQYLTIARARN